MKYELDLFGVMIPTLLLWGVLAFIIERLLSAAMTRAGLYRHIWHSALFEVALYVCVLGTLVFLAHGYIS